MRRIQRAQIGRCFLPAHFRRAKTLWFARAAARRWCSRDSGFASSGKVNDPAQLKKIAEQLRSPQTRLYQNFAFFNPSPWSSCKLQNHCARCQSRKFSGNLKKKTSQNADKPMKTLKAFWAGTHQAKCFRTASRHVGIDALQNKTEPKNL